MSAFLIDGTQIAETIHGETRSKVENLKQRGIQPAITFIRVGNDPASQAYVARKDKMAARLGIAAQTLVLDEQTTEDALFAIIADLNGNPAIHGILVQAPLPPHIREQVIFSSVLPSKDVDGFHPINVGKLMLGAIDGFRPCTPAGIHELLIRSKIPLSGACVAVLGRGNIVGKPMAAMLLQKAPHADATVTVLHSRSRDIAEHCRRADIIIAAIGQPHFVKANMVKPGATVIDVGVNRVDDPASPRGYRLTGDVDFEAASQIAGAITPNPGGVGPMTIAMLMSNTVRACENLCA